MLNRHYYHRIVLLTHVYLADGVSVYCDRTTPIRQDIPYFWLRKMQVETASAKAYNLRHRVCQFLGLIQIEAELIQFALIVLKPLAHPFVSRNRLARYHYHIRVKHRCQFSRCLCPVDILKTFREAYSRFKSSFTISNLFRVIPSTN